MKKILLTALIIFLFLIAGAVSLVLIFDNDNLKPGKDYVIDYVSQTSPYAVKALYDENNHPIDFVIVDAKSGVTRANLDRSAFTYEIRETSSAMQFVLYDNEGVEMGTYNFDTVKGEWIK